MNDDKDKNIIRKLTDKEVQTIINYKEKTEFINELIERISSLNSKYLEEKADLYLKYVEDMFKLKITVMKTKMSLNKELRKFWKSIIEEFGDESTSLIVDSKDMVIMKFDKTNLFGPFLVDNKCSSLDKITLNEFIGGKLTSEEEEKFRKLLNCNPSEVGLEESDEKELDLTMEDNLEEDEIKLEEVDIDEEDTED